MRRITNFAKRLTLLFYKEESSSYDKVLTKIFGSVIIVTNKKEAIKKYEEHYIDLVLVELESNYKKKFNFLDYINQKNIFALTIILSSDKSYKTLTKILDLNVDALFLNLFNKEKILEKISDLKSKYKQLEEYKDDRENLNLLKQYQDITDRSFIISKTDKRGIITYVNDNFSIASGYTKDELMGKNHNMVRSPDSPKELYQDMWNTIKNKKEQWNGILKNISKNGQLYYVKSTISPLLNSDGEIIEYIALRQNISSILTDRQHFLDKISSNLLSVLILVQIEEFDMLEKFHNLNIIDQIEKQFGYKLLTYLPESYKFENVYNLNSGNYALLTNFDSFYNASIMIEDYLLAFIENVKKSRLVIDDIEYDINITLSYSFGKHMIYEDAKSGLELAVKKNIPICLSNDFSIKEQIEAKKNLDVIKMVKQALDQYKILSYFQPIINNKTKQVEKYESLVRLIDDDDNVVSPYEFLSVSKRGQYYNKITERVLRNSFEVLKTIKTELSINLSTLDIEKNETRNLIYSLLKDNEQDCKRLVFELLEDESVKDFNTVKMFIKKVKLMGVSIAIDDFGTGYSNFERLLEFDPNILKIDGSLIKNIITDKYSQNVVETIVTFAKRQDIKTIAEYVENEEIFEYLTDLGVDYSQGFHFGKPECLVF
ncbi:EAL domain-containing protein [Arcobacteraceae bacterium]|nr:EAL domain-containing protein [Arcobacteraceae bacterium]